MNDDDQTPQALFVPRTGRKPGPLEHFLRVETASGLFLFLATLLALGWANSPWTQWYERLWGAALFSTGPSLHFVINEVLMAIFFLVVGLEIRREIHDGALSDRRTATLPLVAAVGGIAAPAAIYLALNDDASVRLGWAVPTATDIAFAVGVLMLLGKRIVPALRVLLLTLAIADDIFAILIIAFFYAEGVALTGLAIAGLGAVASVWLRKKAVHILFPYLVCGGMLWFGLLEAGLHPALAGVALGLLTPISLPAGCGRANQVSLAERLETTLHPWVAFAVMPLFALANAGVNVGAVSFDSATALPLTAGIVLGLVVGKPLGIIAAASMAVRAGWCALPSGVTWSGIALIGCLGGIGFTMSIFIATLAFPDPQLLAAAKFAVLIASVTASTAGLLIGGLTTRPAPRDDRV
jgi:NhaA family Na+:H+ antiporter